MSEAGRVAAGKAVLRLKGVAAPLLQPWFGGGDGRWANLGSVLPELPAFQRSLSLHICLKSHRL